LASVDNIIVFLAKIRTSAKISEHVNEYNSAPTGSRVIVLLAHYNDNVRLKEAILSVREQIPVDILIVDDGSKVRPNQAELQAIYKNGKIIVSLLERNMGSEKARNHGLALISEMDYEFVAAMDSDDRNKENRFYKQVSYMDENPDLMLLGSWCDCVDSNGNFLYTQKYPVTHDALRKKMYINSMFAHATLLFRKKILATIGFYPEQYKWAEDYALAFNATCAFRTENYPEALIYYTINEKGISSMHRQGQVWSRIRIIASHFYLGFYPIYGLMRNVPLLFLPRGLFTKIKQLLK